MSDRIDVERIVRVHTPGGYIEVGTDPDTGEAVQIRTTDPRSIEYFGRVNLTLYSGGVMPWGAPAMISCEFQQPAAVDEAPPPIYYMRDNHTFKRLSENVSTALAEIEGEFNAGYTYGTLCSKRNGFESVHASGNKGRMEFFEDCKAALTAAIATQHQEPKS